MSLVATRLQNWRMLAPNFDKNMARACEYGALDFFVQQNESFNSLLTPEFRRRAEASIGNTLQIPALNYDGDVAVSNTRSCTIADSENTSAIYTVAWTTYSVGFTMVPAAYANNEISYEHDFNRKMNKIVRALGNALDQAAVTALEAGKTQVFKDSLNYTVSANTLAVPTAMASEIIGDINPIMKANCYPEQIHIIGNAGVDSLLRKLAQHGFYNDVNKQLEFDGKVFHFTNNVTNASGQNGTFFAVADGNVAMLIRFDRESERGASANGHEWGKTMLAGLDIPVGYHYYTAVGDQSTTAGAATVDLTCGVKEYFGFSVDVAFITAYNSAPSEVANPIIKAQVAASAAGTPVASPVYVVNAADFPA